MRNTIRRFREISAHRNASLLFVASAISYFGDWIYFTALSALLYSSGGVAAVAGFATLRYIPSVVIPPLAGRLADRFQKDRILIASDLIRGGLMLGLTIVALSGRPSSGLTIALALASAVAGAVFRPARMALLPTLVKDEEQRQALNALDGTIATTALCVAPALGGLGAAALSPAWIFALNGMSFFASAALIGCMTIPPAASFAGKSSPSSVEGDSLTSTASWNVGDVACWVSYYVISHMVVGATWVYLVELANRRFSDGTSATGYLTSVIGIGSVAGMLLGASVPARLRRGAVPACILGMAMLLTALGVDLGPSPLKAAATLLGLGALGILANIAEPAFWTRLQTLVPGRIYGRACGWVDALSVGGLLIGSSASGLLIGKLAINHALLVGGTSAFLLSVVAVAADRVRSASLPAPGLQEVRA